MDDGCLYARLFSVHSMEPALRAQIHTYAETLCHGKRVFAECGVAHSLCIIECGCNILKFDGALSRAAGAGSSLPRVGLRSKMDRLRPSICRAPCTALASVASASARLNILVCETL